MNTPTSGDGFLHELEIEVRQELTLTESSHPDQPTDLPVTDWLYDPTDVERDEAGLRNLLGAVQALEDDSRPGDQDA